MKTLWLFLNLFTLCALHGASQFDIVGPAGSEEFGTQVEVLPNGNIVFTDPEYDLPSPATNDVGAAYLYRPDGTLISMLRGSAASDRVGDDGIVVLTSGHFLIRSPAWNGQRGAVTWGHAETGFIGGGNVIVSSTNSLVGGTASDRIGSIPGGVRPLQNGNYVVLSSSWRNPGTGAANVGAITWGNGMGGTVGVVTSANSMVGTTALDQVGLTSQSVVLPNGNFVVWAPFWDNGSTSNAGAVIWCSGYGPTAGVISNSNSLVGSSAGDGDGLIVHALQNGHFVSTARLWDDSISGKTDVGAVVWGNGNGSTSGDISPSNATYGTSDGDSLQYAGALGDGRYAISSSTWDEPGGVADAGIMKLLPDNAPSTGPLTTAGAMLGGSPGDLVAPQFHSLSNGNNVVALRSWSDPFTSASQVGLVFLLKSGAALPSRATAKLGLSGSTAMDNVGNVGPLPNGNFLVRSNTWTNPATSASSAGAMTWVNGRTGLVGKVSAANSVVGTSPNDQVGGFASKPFIVGQSHCVIGSNSWDDPGTGATNVGAITWMSGTRPTTGVVSAANSIIGSTAGDSLSGVYPLTNGHYVVASTFWDNPDTGVSDVGIVKWCNGFTGTRGVVSATDAFVGVTAGDAVGTVAALQDGNFLVGAPSFDHTAIGVLDAGALTWGSGTNGLIGTPSLSNSVIGSTASDQVGIALNSLDTQPDGSYTVGCDFWDNPVGPLSNAGCIIFGRPGTAVTGFVNESNAIMGTSSFTGGGAAANQARYDQSRRRIYHSRRQSNVVKVATMDGLTSLGRTGESAPGSADIAFHSPGTTAITGSDQSLTDWTLRGSGSSKGRNKALFGRSVWDGSTELVLQTGSVLSVLGSSLPANATTSSTAGQTINQPFRGLFQATVTGTGLTSANNRLLLLDNGVTVSLLRRTGQPLGIAPMTNAKPSAFLEVLQSHDQDLITLTYKLAADKTLPVDSGNDTGLLLMNHQGTITNVMAREGDVSFSGSGNFGQFIGRATASVGNFIHFLAYHDPTGNTPPGQSVFRLRSDGGSATRHTQTGGLAPGTGDASYRTYLGISQIASQAIVRITLGNCPANVNEGLFAIPSQLLLTRKGDLVDNTNLPDVKIAKIIRFWGSGADQLLLHVQLTGTNVNRSNNQAFLLRQGDGIYRVLLRTGQTAPSTGTAKLSSISTIEVNPVTGRYAVLGTLSGTTSATNQAIWTGHSQAGDNTTTLSALRFPTLALRKGSTYQTGTTPQGIIRGLALRPAPDTTGAGGRGLAQTINSTGELALIITADLGVQELVVLDK
ncbi:MAG: hypothetical protein JNJ83_11390 [Verrucomicrobiaceae bacterium]|nr:hypothetical protein [Verrucomicrobiaceae bacterium]